MSGVAFDYETKIWGAPEVRLSPSCIQGLKLRYCLEDLGCLAGRLLDVGCGGGNMAKAIKRYRSDLQVWGVDLSERALAAAVIHPNGTRFVAAAGERLPFAGGFFHAVTMFDVLEHIPEPETALAEIRRVLHPGGLFHLFLPLEKQPYTMYAVLHRLGWKAKEEQCGHIHAFSERESRALLESQGFRVKALRWSFHPFFSLVDIAYFSLLSLLGKKVSTSVEGYIHGSRPTLRRRLLALVNAILVSIGYFESRLLRRFPGGGGHFSLQKM
ncbi:MAG: methyltransferase domain-containing protein [Anaerolineales bacterium]|jgi:SAM-dependent methyltransferase